MTISISHFLRLVDVSQSMLERARERVGAVNQGRTTVLLLHKNSCFAAFVGKKGYP